MTISVNGFAPGETRTYAQRPKDADGGHSVVATSTTLSRGSLRFTFGVTCECGKRYTSKYDTQRAWRSQQAHAAKAIASEPPTAWSRAESDPCQAGTPGCSVDHLPGSSHSCATW
jgi:hypothetical protein